MIVDGTIATNDLGDTVVTNTKIANNAVTSDKIRNGSVTTNKIDENAVTSAKIDNGTIVREDVAANFKAPYSDTADYARLAPAVDSARVAGNSHRLQGKDTTAFAKANHTHPYVDSAGGAQRVGGYDITGLDARYVNENQANSITSGMITDGTIVRQDVAANFKAPYSDTADYARLAPAVDSARVAGNSYKLQGKDTLDLSAKFVDEEQENSVTSRMITDGTILRTDVAPWFKAPYADTADYARTAPGAGDNAWVRGTPDSVLFTIRQLGIARGDANNMLYGNYRYTHVNFGVACTTGRSTDNIPQCAIGGGVPKHRLGPGCHSCWRLL